MCIRDRYTNDLTTVLEKYSSIIKKEGRIYLSFVSDYMKDHDENIKKGYITKFVDSENNEISFAEVVESIEGLKVIHSQNLNLDDTERDISYILEKTGEKIVIPKMKLVEFKEESTPPRRTFRLVK